MAIDRIVFGTLRNDLLTGIYNNSILFGQGDNAQISVSNVVSSLSFGGILSSFTAVRFNSPVPNSFVFSTSGGGSSPVINNIFNLSNSSDIFNSAGQISFSDIRSSLSQHLNVQINQAPNEQINQAPTIVNSIGTQTVTEDQLFAFTITDTFSDAQDGSNLTLNATSVDGSSLPGWLSFNPATGQFSGTPSISDIGSITVRVTATDSSGLSTYDDFFLSVTSSEGIGGTGTTGTSTGGEETGGTDTTGTSTDDGEEETGGTDTTTSTGGEETAGGGTSTSTTGGEETAGGEVTGGTDTTGNSTDDGEEETGGTDTTTSTGGEETAGGGTSTSTTGGEETAGGEVTGGTDTTGNSTDDGEEETGGTDTTTSTGGEETAGSGTSTSTTGGEETAGGEVTVVSEETGGTDTTGTSTNDGEEETGGTDTTSTSTTGGGTSTSTTGGGTSTSTTGDGLQADGDITSEGVETFVFTTDDLANDSLPIVVDTFDSGVDQIDISDFNYTNTSDFNISENGGHSLIDLNNDGQQDVQVVGVTGLTDGDFIF